MKKFLVGVLLIAASTSVLAVQKHPDGSVTLSAQEVQDLQQAVGEMMQFNQAAIQYIQDLEKALAEEKSKKCI